MSRRDHALQNQSPLPPEYRQLEYLESTGTQWIESGIPMRMDDTHEIELFATIELTAFNGDDYFIGGNGTVNNNNSRITPLCWYDNINPIEPLVVANIYDGYDAHGTALLSGFNAGINIKRKYHVFLGLRDRYIEVDGDRKVQYTTSVPSYDTGYTFPIFGRRWRSTTVTAIPYCKLYYLKLIQGTEVYEYLPALRIGDSKPGLYDILHNQFKVNQGTGEFLYN